MMPAGSFDSADDHGLLIGYVLGSAKSLSHHIVKVLAIFAG